MTAYGPPPRREPRPRRRYRRPPAGPDRRARRQGCVWAAPRTRRVRPLLRRGSPRRATRTAPPPTSRRPTFDRRSSTDRARQAEQKWVRTLLAPDTRGRTVTGMYGDVVRERAGVAGQRFVHVGRIAEREIGTSNRAREQQIAAERDAVAVECHEARRVTRHVHHLKSQRTAAELLTVGELLVRPFGLFELDPVHLRRTRRKPRVVRKIQRMQVHGHVESALDCGYGPDVVDVRVREPDRVERGAGTGDHLHDTVSLVAGVDQHGAGRLIVDEEIAVLLEHADGALVHPHTAYPPPPSGSTTPP